MRASLTELRDVAQGIYPAVLSGHGLAVALESLAARATVPVQLTVDLDERPPEAVEVAAYYVVSEALANIGKHSTATAAQVDGAPARVRGCRSRSPTTARAEPSLRNGSGLRGLADRVEALGGSLTVREVRRRWGVRPGGAAMSMSSGPPSAPSAPPVRVAIVEDSVLLREGLRRILTGAGLEVVAAYGNADDLLRWLRVETPDLVLLDIRLPPTHTDEGMRAALQIRREYPAVAVLVLSQYVELGLAVQLLSESGEGVGYLLKDRIGDVAEFLDDVRRVAAGGSVDRPADRLHPAPPPAPRRPDGAADPAGA